MNLRKATKAQLIKEVRRLRAIEIHAKETIQELKRRDAATAKYKQLMPEILQYATSLALFEATTGDPGTWWDHFWEEQDHHDEFWNDRKAERISEYSTEIEKMINAAQDEEIIEIRINPKMWDYCEDNQ